MIAGTQLLAVLSPPQAGLLVQRSDIWTELTLEFSYYA